MRRFAKQSRELRHGSFYRSIPHPEGAQNRSGITGSGWRASYPFLTKVRGVDDNVLVLSSGYFLRVLAARWLGLEGAGGPYLLLGTASLSAGV